MNGNSNEISLDTAIDWAKKWRQVEGTYNAHHSLKAFFIPKEDILALLAEGIDGIRAYVGVDENDKEKLMMVGTKHNINPDSPDKYEDMLPDRSGRLNGIILDFTSPCPHMCDRNSTLYKLD